MIINMNRKQAKELLPIIQAFAEGKIIEFRTNSISRWIETTTPKFDLLHEYRIKPNPKYRPFTNREECWEEMLKHQPFGWIKDVSVICNIVSIREDGIITNTNVGNNWCDFESSIHLKFVDNTPFGIKE